ncbi:MAG: flagellar hook-associated protein FlgK [Candidatus Eremiobacteraeota bacterium]|nr:flagellar hook-associated protein FlgK [Candidatus Eremiobacteraeota bacterium]
MSFFGLTIAGKALAAYQQAENVTSDNIANVNTPGASRNQAILTEASPITGTIGYPALTIPGTTGDGVLLQMILRVHQDSYDTLFRNASSSQYFYSIQQSQLNAAQATISEPNGGVNDAYTAFQSSIQQLQAQPSDPSVRAGVISSAQQLVNAISTTGNSLQQQEANVFQQAQTQVTQINTILDEIAQLNGQIRASHAAGDNPNTFQDQRDHLIDQLSQLISTQTSVQANGSTLVTVNGLALVNDTIAYHLAAPVIGTNPNGTPTLKVGFVFDPNPLNPTPVPLGQGSLAGLVDLYNNKLTVYSQNLDAWTNALATEVDRVTTSGFDQNGVPGVPLLQPIVATKAISATNIKVGITQPGQVVAALASTAAGNLVNAVNSSNQTLDTSTSLINNPQLQISPAAGPIAGTLTVNVDNVNRVLTYSTTSGAATIDASSVDNFITSFNAQHIGVTASYDTTGQKLVFQRDSNNEDLIQRTQPGYAPSPNFSIHDSNNPGTAAGQGIAGSILGILGAANLDGIANSQLTTDVAAGATVLTVSNPVQFAVGQNVRLDQNNPNAETVTITAINGNQITVTATANAHTSNAEIYALQANIAVVQNATNAFASMDNSAALALTKMFQLPVGVPGVSTYAATFAPASPFVAPPGQSVTTVTEQVFGPLAQFGNVNVGQQYTFVNQAGQQVTAVVTALNRIAGTLTFTVTNNTGAAITFQPTPGVPPPYTAIIASPVQTLGQYYGSFMGQVGLDGQTATTGTNTQTNIAANIDKVRQGIDGINLDEETQNLIKYQTAYQAAAKTVTIMDSMLQSILSMGQ